MEGLPWWPSKKCLNRETTTASIFYLKNFCDKKICSPICSEIVYIMLTEYPNRRCLIKTLNESSDVIHMHMRLNEFRLQVTFLYGKLSYLWQVACFCMRKTFSGDESSSTGNALQSFLLRLTWRTIGRNVNVPSAIEIAI